MGKFMLGKKAGMTQFFDENDNAIPVTVIDCGPVTVVQKKTEANDQYDAVKVAYEEVRENLLNKPDRGQFANSGDKVYRTLSEFRVDDDIDQYELGQVINVGEMFEAGDKVDISGISKGKGFAGNVKRHKQAGGLEAHGSRYHRRVGSLGAAASPSRVMKGKKLPGHMGHVYVTVQNLEVVMVDGERNILVVKGSIPGPRGNVVEIADSVKA